MINIKIPRQAIYRSFTDDKQDLPLGGEDNPVPLIEFKDVYETEKILPTPPRAVREKVNETESQAPTHRSKRRRKRS